MKAILDDTMALFGYSIREGKDGMYQCVLGGITSSLQPWSSTSTSYAGDAFRVNQQDNVRGPADKYGRMATMLRRSMTNNDKNPFQVQA